MHINNYDFLIVGSGLAGLYTAYCASKHGSVALITKAELEVSNSHFAQGGIAVVTDQNDFPEDHLKDTLIAGRDLCEIKPVEILVNEGPSRIKDLIELGMQFDTVDGSLALGLEGGHHKRRVLHAGGDATGKEVTDFLISKIKNIKSISIFEDESVFNILTEKGICYGVQSWSKKLDQERTFTSKTTILCLGGASAIYKRSTNPETTVGDGIALAYKSGLEICDMEFIQFHPSAFYSPNKRTFLISEAVRGEGAYLLNKAGERFMQEIHPLAELAPRDVVSQSIFNQMKLDNNQFVTLSLKHLNSEKIIKRFPSIFKKCKDAGIDMTNEIPISPAAHYTVGGVKTGMNGETSINNLYICGEMASTGVMGANRLASNSLLECLVFGERAIKHTINQIKLTETPEFSKCNYYIQTKNEKPFIDFKNKIANILNTKVGIIRNEDELTQAIEEIHNIEQLFSFKPNEHYSIKLQNLICVARLIINGALARKESRGGHLRDNYTSENPDFLKHSIQKLGETISFIPVNTIKNKF